MAQLNTPQEVLNFITQLNSVELNAAQIRLGIVFSHEVEYQRFNPILLRAVLWSKETGKDEEVFRTDQMKLLVFILTRGTNYEKAKLNLPSDAKATMDNLIRKYDIKIDPNVETGSRGTNARRTRLKETDVSLGRISACWPQWSAQLLAQAESGPLLKWVNLTPGIPSYLCFPQSASIVPKNNTILMGFARTFYNEFDKTINRNVVRDEKYNMFRDQFFETIKESPLFNDQERSNLMARLETLSQTKVRAIVNQNQTMASILNTIAGLNPNAPVQLNDPQHGQNAQQQPQSNAAQMARQQRAAARQQQQQAQQQQQRQQQQQFQQQQAVTGVGSPMAPPMSSTSTNDPLAMTSLTRMTSPGGGGTNPFMTTTPGRIQFNTDAKNDDDDDEEPIPRMTYDMFTQHYRQAEFNQVPTPLINTLSALGVPSGSYSVQTLQEYFGVEPSPQEYGVEVAQDGSMRFHLPK